MKRILLLAHRRELIEQAQQHARNAGLTAGIEMGEDRASQEQVVCSSVQTQVSKQKCKRCKRHGCPECDGRGWFYRFEKFNPHDFALVVVDEAHHCHVSGTVIETDSGSVAIEDISVGDLVWSWDGKHLCKKRVVRKFAYWHDGPVKSIICERGTVRTTLNHRMYSDGRKQFACDLEIGDTISMPIMRRDYGEQVLHSNAHEVEASRHETLSGVFGDRAEARIGGACREPQGGSCNLPCVRDANGKVFTRRSCRVEACKQLFCRPRESQTSYAKAVSESRIQKAVIRQDENAESDGFASGSEFHVGDDTAKNGSWGPGPIREQAIVREWWCANASGESILGDVSISDIQLCDSSKGQSKTISLQGGCCVRQGANCSGDRWNVTRQQDTCRQQEGRATSEDRLAGRATDKRYCSLGESTIIDASVWHYRGYVYDFEVEDTHNYIANGLLSSNSAATTYRRVIEHYLKNPALKVLGVTATPHRGDGVGLWNVFDACSYEMDIGKAVGDGWLVPVLQQFVTVNGLDLTTVETKAGGDLADGALERAMLGNGSVDEAKMLHSIAAPLVDIAKGKPTLVFASGCDHAEKLTAAFNSYPGVIAECVLGSTDASQRARIMKRYKSGEVNVLVNVGVATEGFDAPATAIVGIARPTKSLSLYTQCIGRGTRPLPGVVDGPETAEARKLAIASSAKPECLVVDFCGNAGRHKLISLVDVLAGEAAEELRQEMVSIAKEEGQALSIEELQAKVEEAKKRREEAEQAEREARRDRYRAERVDYTTDVVDLYRADNRALLLESVWESRTGDLSDKQFRLLCKLGINPETASGYSKRQAGAVLDAKLKATGGDFVLPFGKHSGKKISQCPKGYLQWLIDKNIGKASEHARDHLYGRRNAVAVEDVPF